MKPREPLNLRARLAASRKNSRLRAIMDGTASAALAKVLTTLLSLISLPLCVHDFGPERYGVWVTIVSTSAWIAVLEFGLTDTITNVISASHATEDQENAARHATNALAITLAFAIFLFCLGSLVWNHLDWMKILNVSDRLASVDIRNTIAIACSLVLLTPLCTIGLKILSGYQQTHIANLVTALGAVASVIGLICGIELHLTMPWLFFWSNGMVTLSGLATLFWTLFRAKPWLRPRLHHISPALSGALLTAGLPFFAIRIAGVIVFSTDNVIVSHYLGAAQVTPYSIAMRLVTYAQLVPTFVFPSLWAAYAAANARGDFAWIRRAYRKTRNSSIALMAAPLIFLAIFGRWIIGRWAGAAAIPSESLLLAMCAWTLIAGATGVQSCLLGAIQRNRLQAVASVAAAVLNLVLSIFLVQRVGSIGAVEGTLLSYLLIVGPQSWEIKRYFAEHEAPIPAPSIAG
jgi:O-antigen/teichoic acid export membrane protein